MENEEPEFQAGERLYLGQTTIDDPDLREHLSRYEFAKKHISSHDRVLDAACGTGYGTAMLGELAAKAVGFEVSEHGVRWANQHHKKDNITYVRGDLNKKLPFEDSSFSVVTSFETLEHIENQENMLSEFRRILKPGGLLILSSPDREIITERAGNDNKFHVHELSKKEFVSLVKKYFTLDSLYGQSKYKKLPFSKQIIKQVARVDVLDWHRPVVRALGLTKAVHRSLAEVEYLPIEPTNPDGPSDFYVLLAMGRKR